jgi:hypothetical protein
VIRASVPPLTLYDEIACDRILAVLDKAENKRAQVALDRIAASCELNGRDIAMFIVRFVA